MPRGAEHDSALDRGCDRRERASGSALEAALPVFRCKPSFARDHSGEECAVRCASAQRQRITQEGYAPTAQGDEWRRAQVTVARSLVLWTVGIGIIAGHIVLHLADKTFERFAKEDRT